MYNNVYKYVIYCGPKQRKYAQNAACRKLESMSHTQSFINASVSGLSRSARL